MSSELSGTMDTAKSPRNRPDDQDQGAQASSCKTFAANSFTVHDLADEEVHFSLSSSEHYYQFNGAQANGTNFSGTSQLPFNDINNNERQPTNPIASKQSTHPSGTSIGGLALASQQAPATQTAQDQLVSNRILSSIGNKLRRGSNYLIAPKLVGQYLLGITIRSWSEFLNTTRMLRAPTNRQQLTRRLVTNLNYFQGNYLCVSLILVIYCILTSPLLLLAIAGLLLAMYLVTARSALGKQMRLMGYRLNLQQQYSCITMVWLPLLWVSGAPSAIFWVIGASFFVVGLHASMYANETRLPNLDPSSAIEQNHQQSISNNHQQRNRIDSVALGAGHRQLGGNIDHSVAGDYYNHYHHQQDSINSTRRQLYTALPLESPNHMTTKDKHSSSKGFMSAAFSQWVSFGASNKSPTGDHLAEQGANYQRIPEVNIISQDYAGLGRVYEV